jgi:signal transduction histidine kinase/HAMP domain-containing protein
MRRGIGIRVWLPLAFALVAAVTAVAVERGVSSGSESAFRERAQELAAGNAFESAIEIGTGSSARDLEQVVRETADRHRLALFVFARDGVLLTPRTSRGVELDEVPGARAAVARALAGRRYADTSDELRATVVALPLRAEGLAALVAYAPHPELAAELGLVRDETIEAALWAVLVGAVVGALLASLIARRLRGIAAAAAAIEDGQFDRPVQAGFGDELGRLAESIDRMRVRLRASFGRLAAERDRVRRLLERLHEGVITVDRGLEIELANRRAAELVGPAAREGEPLPDPWPDTSLRGLAAALFEPGAGVAEARVELSDELVYLVVGLPPGADGETAVLVVADISDRERLERAEREFVTNAAHELRTPLTTIVGAVEQLQAGSKDVPAERERFLGHLERESARLASLVRALLVLARAQTRQESPRFVAVDVEPILERAAAGARPADGVELTVSCPPGLSVLTDPDLLEQALANLVANAAKYTERGRIELAAEQVGPGGVTIEVRDTGRGMSAAVREAATRRFYRGAPRGTNGFGLGLAIVQQAVAALDGKLELDSVPGHGTTVRLRLPAAEAQAA